MKRFEKQQKLAAAARTVVKNLKNNTAVVGTDTYAFNVDGTPSNVIGAVLKQAGIATRTVVGSGTRETAFAMALGTEVSVLPQNVKNALEAVNNAETRLARRPYVRRGRVAAPLANLATALATAKIRKPYTRNTTTLSTSL